MSEGILYIASGSKYVEQAKISARSAKSRMAGTPTAIVTDQTVRSDVFDHVIKRPDMQGSFADKATYMSETPFRRTLFLDCDTYITESIAEIWSLLDYYDVAATHSVHRRYEHPLPVPIPEYSTGVILFNDTEGVSNLLEDWKACIGDLGEMERYGVLVDQPSFRYALFENEAVKGQIDFLTLPREYNTICDGNMGYLKGPAKILHGSNSRDEFEKLATALNKHTETPGDDKRVYYPQWWPRDGIAVRAKSPNGTGRRHVFVQDIREEGLLQAVIKWTDRLRRNVLNI